MSMFWISCVSYYVFLRGKREEKRENSNWGQEEAEESRVNAPWSYFFQWLVDAVDYSISAEGAQRESCTLSCHYSFPLESRKHAYCTQASHSADNPSLYRLSPVDLLWFYFMLFHNINLCGVMRLRSVKWTFQILWVIIGITLQHVYSMNLFGGFACQSLVLDFCLFLPDHTLQTVSSKHQQDLFLLWMQTQEGFPV